MPTKGEGGSTGCPTMDMAYQKFKGDMRAIEQAAAAASKRALDAEKRPRMRGRQPHAASQRSEC